MRKPPDDTQGPTWLPRSLIVSTPYRVRHELGRGGMGSVYEVEHTETGLLYAFKVLSTRVAAYPELAERVVREAEFVGLLDRTPHVVTVVEWGRLRDEHRRPFLVMERLYGHPLATLLVRRALPVADALFYIRQVLWGLAAVHGAGGLHRDIKPSNLFVQDNGTCTLLDFGVMKALSEIGLSPRQFITDKDMPIGTPLYMAPEMASGAVVDHRADLFSVGLVLLECLLGFRLWSDLSEDAYRQRLVNEGVPSLELIGGGHLPAEVQRLVRRATLLNPAKRFPTALAMIAEIDRVAAALGLWLRPVPPSEHLGASGRPPPRLFRTDAPTWSAVGAAPRPRTPSERTPSARGASVEPAALWTVSAWPTRVDSVSPTRVKTPALRGGAEPTPAPTSVAERTPASTSGDERTPASGDARTPPLASQRRFRWRGLLWGRGDHAPGAAPAPPVGSREQPTTTLPLPPVGSRERPTTTLALPPRSGVSWRLPRLRDRLAPVRDSDTPAVDDVLAGPRPANDVLAGPAPAGALAVLTPEPPVEPKPTEQPRGAWRVRPVSAFALGAAGVAAGVVATLAGLWVVGPPVAIERVAPEPRRAAPAGVIASVQAPAIESPAEPRPPEASPPALAPHAPVSSAGSARALASPARGNQRARLEAKLRSGQGTMADAGSLASLCHASGDEACLRLALEFFQSGGAR
jgi:serine/threonine protein kinase